MGSEASTGAASDNGSPDVFTATYHDTADRRLARAQIALRRRLSNGTGLWEAEIGGEIVSAPGGPATLPEELARRLTAPLRNRSLEEVVRLRTGTKDVALLEGQHVLRSYESLDTASARHRYARSRTANAQAGSGDRARAGLSKGAGGRDRAHRSAHPLG